MVLEEVVSPNGTRRMTPSDAYKPRTWQWLNVKQGVSKFNVKLIDKELAFNFCLYLYTLRGITKVIFSRSRVES